MGNVDGNAYAFRRWAALAALVGVSLIAGPAAAERVSRSSFDAFMDLSTGATKHTIGMSSNGVPIATRGVPGATAVGNMNFAHADGAWPVARADVDVPSPITGKPLSATAKQGFSKASQAAALGRFAAKVITPLAVGVAIFDLVRELGGQGEWELERSTDGTDNKFWRYTDGTYCEANCFEFAWTESGTWYLTNIDAVRAYAQQATFGPGYSFNGSVSCDGPTSNSCRYGVSGNGLPSGYTESRTVFSRSVPPYDSRTRNLSSEDAFVGALAAVSGWPSSSTAIDRALADAMNSRLVDLQKSLDAEMPAEITASETKVVSDPKTSTLSDGTTKTEQTTCEWVQGIPPGPLQWNCWTNETTVTPQKTTTETVVRSNPDGTTSTETITKTTPSTTTTGTTTASASELDEKLCADGTRRLGCSELDAPTQDMPKTTHTITYAPDDLGFGGGACPAPYAWSDSLGSHAIDLAPLCAKLVSVVRPLVIAFALLMAVFIVLPRET